MDILALSTSQLCCLLSIFLAFIELVCFYIIRNKINLTTEHDPIFEQLEHFFNELKPIHIITYITTYGALLYAARFFPFVFFIIFSIQLISLICNLGILIRFKR